MFSVAGLRTAERAGSDGVHKDVVIGQILLGVGFSKADEGVVQAFTLAAIPCQYRWVAGAGVGIGQGPAKERCIIRELVDTNVTFAGADGDTPLHIAELP